MESIETCYRCENCPKLFNSLGKYNQHLNTHTKPYSCDSCSKNFALRADLNRHVQARHRLGQRKYPCVIEGCKFETIRKDNIRQHLRKSHKNHPSMPLMQKSKRRCINGVGSPIHSKQSLEAATPLDVHSTLIQAASAGNISLVETMFRLGAHLSMQADDGSTALHCAIKANKVEMVQFLLISKAPLEIRNNRNATPLLEAILEGNRDVFDLLLQHGAVPCEAVLKEVIKYGNLELFRNMLSRLENDYIASMGRFMIRIASRFGQDSMLQLLLSHHSINRQSIANFGRKFWLNVFTRVPTFACLMASGKIDPNEHLDWVSLTLLHLATANGRVEILEILLRCPDIDVNKSRYHGGTALHMAAAKGKANCVKTLLQHPKTLINGGEPSHFSYQPPEPTTLHYGARSGNVEVMEALMSRGDCLFNSKDGQSRTPLQAAVYYGRLEAVQYMLQNPQVDIGVRRSDGTNVLQLAVQRGYVDVVETFLKSPRIDLSAPSNCIHSLLKKALWSVQWPVIRLLLEHNNEYGCWKSDRDMSLFCDENTTEANVLTILLDAQVFSMDERGSLDQTLLHRAAKYNNIMLVKFFLQPDHVDPSLIDRYRQTALHYAASRGHFKVLELLLQDGRVDVNALSGSRRTALHMATERRRVNVVDLLLHDERLNINAIWRPPYSWWTGGTALDVAKQKQYQELINLLLSYGAKSQSEVENGHPLNGQVLAQGAQDPDHIHRQDERESDLELDSPANSEPESDSDNMESEDERIQDDEEWAMYLNLDD